MAGAAVEEQGELSVSGVLEGRPEEGAFELRFPE